MPEYKMELKKFLELELKLISYNSLMALLKTIVYEYRQFYQYDCVSLIIFDQNYEYRHILKDENIQPEDYPELIFFDDPVALKDFYGKPAKAVLGPFEITTHSFMFSYNTQNLASCAFLPLQIDNQLIGSFNIASTRKDHFLSNSDTEFLQPLCDIFAICLKNILHSEHLKRIGLTDGLTGINNRRFFDQRIYEEVTYTQRTKEPLTCLFFDVDHFKKVNDLHGHPAGDFVLKEVAGIIRTHLRVRDVLARYGGEEFAALLINTDAYAAFEIADRIRERIAKKSFIMDNGKSINITISIGMATLDRPSSDEDPGKIGDELIKQADEHLYLAKTNGRNCVSNNDNLIEES